MTEQERMTKLEGAKTLIARARRRTIGCASYRGDITHSNLETARDLVVAEELIEQVMKEFDRQDDILSLTETGK